MAAARHNTRISHKDVLFWHTRHWCAVARPFAVTATPIVPIAFVQNWHVPTKTIETPRKRSKWILRMKLKRISRLPLRIQHFEIRICCIWHSACPFVFILANWKFLFSASWQTTKVQKRWMIPLECDRSKKEMRIDFEDFDTHKNDIESVFEAVWMAFALTIDVIEEKKWKWFACKETKFRRMNSSKNIFGVL